MKIIKKRVRLIGIVFACIVFFQSCRVYKHNNVPLEIAAEEGKRVKIKTNDGQTIKFKKIVLENDQYFGVKKFNGENVLIEINHSNIKTIRLHNKGLSIMSSFGIGLFVVVVSTLVYAIFNINPVKSVDFDIPYN